MSQEPITGSSIADLPDNPYYTIKDVSVQTGIRTVTLRAWERRYTLLTPYRSTNRYRLYSDRDIAILRWIKSRLDSGISISAAVSELKAMQQSGNYPIALPVITQPKPQIQTLPPEAYARQLYQRLIKHDETGVSQLLSEIQSAFELNVMFEAIITPCLIEIGIAWYTGEIRITTEHFATNLLRGKLLTIFQALPIRRNAPYVQVGCAPTEQHELGALMMAVLLRQAGVRIEYLGPDVPVEDLVEYARFEKPAMIIMTATSEPAALEMKEMQPRLARLRPVPLFGYGGPVFNSLPKLRERIPGFFLGETLTDATAKTRELLKMK